MKIKSLFLAVIFSSYIFADVLTPQQKQEYINLKMQLANLPNTSNPKDVESYLKKVGSKMALRLWDNLKKIEKLTTEGTSLIAAQKYKEASEKYTQAIMIDDEFPFLWERRGTCYSSMQNFPQAINDFNRAIMLAPGTGFLYTLRAVCYQVIGNSQQAFNDLKIAASLGEPEATKIVNAYNQSQKNEIKRSIEERFGFKPGTIDF